MEIYRKYDKDELLVFGTPKKGTHFRFRFLPTNSFRVHSRQPQSPTSYRTPDAATKQRTEGEEAVAASKIVLWWKRHCIPRLLERKEKAKVRAAKLASGTALGQAQVTIDDILVEALRPRYWHQRNILETSGVELLEGIIDLVNRINTAHQRAMEVLKSTDGKYKLSTSSVEDIQDTLGRLGKRKNYLDKQKTIFTKQEEARGLLHMSAEELQQKMDTALDMLHSYQKEVEIWGTEIDECLQ